MMTSVNFLRGCDRLAAGRAPPSGNPYGPSVSTVLTKPVEPAQRKPTARADLYAGAAALGLVGLATAVGFLAGVRRYGDASFAGVPAGFGEYPILGTLLPRVSPMSAAAVLVAVAVVVWGPGLAARLRWRSLLAVGYLGSVAWILTLSLVDGWRRGLAQPMHDYVGTAGNLPDLGAFVRGFSSRILDVWPTHVSAHPPGATLVFAWLDRLGLPGTSAAAVFCVLLVGLIAVAVPVTVAALGRPDLARAALPFVVLMPGALWLGVSGDAMFAAVTASGIALLALGTRHTGWRFAALSAAAGVVLGFGIFLSYGLLLMAPVALAVVLVSRRWTALVWAVPAALAVAATFALAGFWWLEGYHLVVERYSTGIASVRPYWYWIWANLACLVLVVGPATAAGLRRAAPDFLTFRPTPVVALVRGAALAVLTADVSGLSKAEVERIWLPFAVWLVLAAALLPAAHRRWWLAAQAATALVVGHVLLTAW
jgi:methylthioxylose transferase